MLYKVKLIVEGNIDIEEPIEASSEDEAVNIAIKEYGNEAWYNFYGETELIEEGEENELY